jgi:hypothetical protein
VTHREKPKQMKHLSGRPVVYFVLFFATLLVLIKCASQDVVVEVVSEPSPSPSPSAAPADEAYSGATPESLPLPAPTAAVTVTPAFAKLIKLLKSKGYEGVGLEFETDATLEILTQVFSDPRTKGRKLKTIYTGAVNAYDSRAASVTIAKTTNAKEILAFITKQVPLETKSRPRKSAVPADAPKAPTKKR